MNLAPIVFRAANAFVKEHHRHSAEVPGCCFCTSVVVNGAVLSIGIAGRPISRKLQDGFTFEITRVCSLGAPNACSMIYGALTRAAKALGYRRGITYTLASEPGTSLRAAGWRLVAEVRAESWHREKRWRHDKHRIEPRLRWEWP